MAADGTVRTWGTGVALRLIRRAVPIRDRQPVAVALSGDRIRVLWAAGPTIQLHENVKGAWPRDESFRSSAPVRALALSPSGALAVVACDDATLRTLNAGTGEFGVPLAIGTPAVRAVAVASDRGPVVAAFENGDVRYYDLAAGTSDLIAGTHYVAGSGLGADLVAVSPDGEAVITAARGFFLRWNRSDGAYAVHGTDTTTVRAMAVDGTGGTVLAARDDGTLWLHDMGSGSAVEFLPPAPSTRAASPPDQARRDDPPSAMAAPSQYAPPPSAGNVLPPTSAGDAVVDNDVRFAVYRPQALSPGVRASLLVFAHKTDLIEEPGRPPFDPGQEVEAIARAYFGNMPVRLSGVDSRIGVFRDARLRIMVDLPGVRCDPAAAEFDWREPIHQVVFLLQAGPHLVGSVARGAVRILCGPLIIGEMSLAIRVTASPPPIAPPVAELAARYRKVFPSYSHADGAIVDAFTEVIRTFGDQYLRDVTALRAGERWRERLPVLIEEADVFQLFWSTNSMRSRYCREEWEHALSLGRPLFVRPFYWEDPRPADPANGLPPPALDTLEFVKLSLYAIWGGIPASRGAPPEPAAVARSAEPDHSPPTYPASPPPPGPSQTGAYRAWPQASAPPPPERAGRSPGRRRMLVGAVALVVLVVLVVIIVFLLRG